MFEFYRHIALFSLVFRYYDIFRFIPYPRIIILPVLIRICYKHFIVYFADFLSPSSCMAWVTTSANSLGFNSFNFSHIPRNVPPPSIRSSNSIILLPLVQQYTLSILNPESFPVAASENACPTLRSSLRK